LGWEGEGGGGVEGRGRCGRGGRWHGVGDTKTQLFKQRSSLKLPRPFSHCQSLANIPTPRGTRTSPAAPCSDRSPQTPPANVEQPSAKFTRHIPFQIFNCRGPTTRSRHSSRCKSLDGSTCPVTGHKNKHSGRHERARCRDSGIVFIVY
jgi:hypothetical protein